MIAREGGDERLPRFMVKKVRLILNPSNNAKQVTTNLEGHFSEVCFYYHKMRLFHLRVYFKVPFGSL